MNLLIAILIIAAVGIAFSIWLFVENMSAKREADRLYAEYQARMKVLLADVDEHLARVYAGEKVIQGVVEEFGPPTRPQSPKNSS